MNYFNPFQQNYDNMYSYNTVPQVVKVNGYNGANAYQLPPNASALREQIRSAIRQQQHQLQLVKQRHS